MDRQVGLKLLAPLVLLIVVSVAIQAAPSGKFSSKNSKSVDAEKDLEKETPLAIERFRKGDQIAFFAHWDRVLKSNTDEKWRADELEKLAAPLVALQKVGKAADPNEQWIAIYRSLMDRTDPRFVSSIATLDRLAAPHAMAELKRDRSKELWEWYMGLENEKKEVYFSGLRHQNRFLHQLRIAVNPGRDDPDELPAEPRLTLVKEFLETPFFRRLQPFNNKTFKQLIGLKCLSADELFEHREEMLNAHVRQGMAYLDLARIYRQNGYYDEALDYIDIGMTLHNHNENRIGCFLLEKIIILRDSGKGWKAQAILEALPVDDLDRSNTALLAQIKPTL